MIALTGTLTPTRSRVFRWLVAILLIGHGLIHAMGPVEIWGIADLEQLTGEPSIRIEAASELLAVVWLIALVVLVAAGLALLARRDWWPTLALIGVAVSQLVIVIWWSDAATGTIPNLLVVVGVALAGRLGLHRPDSADAG